MPDDSKSMDAINESRGYRDDKRSGKSGNNLRDRSPLARDRKGASEKRVFVSNIPYEYRWQDLKDLFRDEVGEVAYVELFTDEKNKPRGCGIVEFEKTENVSLAIEKMHRFELKGRKLVVKEDTNSDRDKQSKRFSNSGNGSGNASQSRSQWAETNITNTSSSTNWSNTYGLSPQFLESLNIHGPLINKVFVANLDYKVDEKKLRDVFKLAGRVINVDLLTDKDGKSRGIGTVEFEHPVEAVQAISMLHNQVLYERRIHVRMDKSNENSDGPMKLPDGLKGIGLGLGANGAPLSDVTKNMPSLNLSSVQPSNTNLSTSTPSALAALAGSLSQQLDSRLLDNALARRQLEMVGSLGNSLISNNSAADFSSLSSANLSSSFGTCLGVNKSSSVSGGAFLNSSNPFGKGSSDSLSAVLSSSISKFGNSIDCVGSVGLRQPERYSDTILIKNLPPNTTWKVLRDQFREAGDIKFAEMKGRDLGMIRFSSETDAKRAVSMFDNYRLDGKMLAVELF